MIHVGRVLNPEFAKAMIKLTTQPLPIKEAYRLTATIDKVNEEIDKFRDARQALVVELAEKDERGEPKVEGQSYVFGEKQAEFNSRLQGLLDHEFEVQPFTVDLFPNLQITVEEATLLRPILSQENQYKEAPK